MHPDKTFLGCIKKGFDFLGIHFGDTPKISNQSLDNHRSKLAQRYAQGAGEACIGRHKERWTSWCDSVVNCCRSTIQVNPKTYPTMHQGYTLAPNREYSYENNESKITMQAGTIC